MGIGIGAGRRDSGIGGGGSSASKSGGLKLGLRSRCMGLCTAAAACARCAAGGRVRAGVYVSGRAEVCMPSNDGTRGDVVDALGQPHVRCWLGPASAWLEYSGSARLTVVALQSRKVIGESIDISKCRRFLGSVSSAREIRMIILSCQHWSL